MYDINSLDTTIKHNITDLTIQYDIHLSTKSRDTVASEKLLHSNSLKSIHKHFIS